MKRVCRGEARIMWTAEIPEGVNANICDHPAVEAVLGFIPQAGDVWIDGDDKPPVKMFVEIHEEDVAIEEDEEVE